MSKATKFLLYLGMNSNPKKRKKRYPDRMIFGNDQHKEVVKHGLDHIWTVIKDKDTNERKVINGYIRPPEGSEVEGFMVSSKPYTGKNLSIII